LLKTRREHPVWEDDRSVPPPNMASPCWAKPKRAKNRTAKSEPRIDNFLKTNLLISS